MRHKKNMHKLGEMEEDAVDFLAGRSLAGRLIDPCKPDPGYNIDGSQLCDMPKKHRKQRMRKQQSKRNEGTLTIMS